MVYFYAILSENIENLECMKTVLMRKHYGTTGGIVDAGAAIHCESIWTGISDASGIGAVRRASSGCGPYGEVD